MLDKHDRKSRISRRTLMKAAGMGIVAGAASSTAAQQKPAQNFGCTTFPPLGAAKAKPKDQSFLNEDGFKNTTADGRKGFQIKLRVDDYRSLPLDRIETITVKVDGKECRPEDLVFILEDRRYKVEELRNTRGLYWQVLDYATVFVPEPGGLAPGEHEVEVKLKKILPGWAASGPPGASINHGKRRLTLNAEI
jgi:hypothetical protein